jgi:hypothetical protein
MKKRNKSRETEMKFKVGDEIILRAKVYDTQYLKYGIEIGDKSIHILPKDLENCAIISTKSSIYMLDDFMDDIRKEGVRVHVVSEVKKLKDDGQIKDYFVHSVTLNDKYIIMQYVLLFANNAHRVILFECDLNGYFARIIYDRFLK